MSDLSKAIAAETPQDEPANKGSIDITPDGAAVNNVVVDSPVNEDWSTVFALFNLSADDFIVVDDTVKMSTWQQSRRTESGDRDAIQLYSYSARFKRRDKDAISPEVVKSWREALVVNEPALAAATPQGAGTYVVLPADGQLGKKRTEEAVENLKRGVIEHCDAIKRLQERGTPPEAVHLGWQGDETEGVCNNYTNQSHTIELNLSGQLELDYDLRVWATRHLASLGLPMSASSVISNHGEWTRNGSKDPVTTRGDNASTYIARQVKKLFDELEPFGGPSIDWTIAGGDPGVTRTLSGIESYFSHGYIEKGKGASTEIRTKSAIERQILGRTDSLGAIKLWFMAHYHHFYATEFEGRTLFGCPALEAERSSEYMLDQYGVWSPPGMLGLLVGDYTQRGWSDLAVY